MIFDLFFVFCFLFFGAILLIQCPLLTLNSDPLGSRPQTEGLSEVAHGKGLDKDKVTCFKDLFSLASPTSSSSHDLSWAFFFWPPRAARPCCLLR